MPISFIRYLKAVADLILPRRCLVCDRKLLVDEDHLCLNCLCDMPLTYFWKRLYNPMADRFNELLSEVDLDVSGYVMACSLFYYDSKGTYRKIPYQLKYSGNLPSGRFFGKMLGERMAVQGHWADVDCVIPVPLHWMRRWKRGYNQAEIVAEAMAEALGAKLCCSILRKSRYTRTQTKMDIEQKRQNVKESFSISPKLRYVSYKHILIVDDTFTTGNTLFACFQALRIVFPPSVRISVATLAFVGGT